MSGAIKRILGRIANRINGSRGGVSSADEVASFWMGNLPKERVPIFVVEVLAEFFAFFREGNAIVFEDFEIGIGREKSKVGLCQQDGNH